MQLNTKNILYLDNHLLVIDKPPGMLIQGDRTGDISLFEIAKKFIKEKYNKPGNVYLGLVHRLDRPASGVVCFARTSKAAARLSEQFRKKSTVKIYRAIVEGLIPESGKFEDNILRRETTSFISQDGKGKPADLTFRKIVAKNNRSLVEIKLGTGRHHQIRVQFASRGFPVIGDFRYGSKLKFPDRTIALHAYSLTIEHPTKKEIVTFSCNPGKNWPIEYQRIHKKYGQYNSNSRYH